MKLNLTAHTAGRCLPLAEVSDPVFSREIVGRGVAIEPEIGEVCAPADGTVTMVAETKHCIGLDVAGMEVLIHVGVDTVTLGGKYFNPLVRPGQAVHRGQPLLRFDLKKLRAKGFETVVPMVITNHDGLAGLEFSYGAVQKQDTVIVATM